MAELIKFEYLDEFVGYNRQLIEEHHLSHYHLIGALERLARRQADLYGAFNIVGEDDNFLLGLWITGALYLYSTKWDSSIISELVNYIPLDKFKEEFQFAGQRELVLELLTSQNISYEILKDRLVYECVKTNTIQFANGKIEQSAISDLDEIAQMSYSYHVEEYDGKGGRDFDSMKSVAKYGIESSTLFTWNDEGICSIAQIIDGDSDIPLIGQLYTKQDKRGNGYATSLVYHLTNNLLANGAEKCGLMSDVANSQSNKAFLKVGYQPIYKFIICIRTK